MTFQQSPDWLVKRLTPYKRTVARWVELGRAIQNFWLLHFDPEFAKFSKLQSIYTADQDGKRRIVAELGGYFERDLPATNQEMSVAQRKLEIQQKETDVIIRMAVRRLGYKNVAWYPLYALESDGPYGTEFYHEGIGVPEGAYLTSRGILVADADVTDPHVYDLLQSRVLQVKPTHIAFDGIFYGSFNLATEDDFFLMTEDGIQLVTEEAYLRHLMTESEIELATEDGYPIVF